MIVGVYDANEIEGASEAISEDVIDLRLREDQGSAKSVAIVPGATRFRQDGFVVSLACENARFHMSASNIDHPTSPLFQISCLYFLLKPHLPHEHYIMSSEAALSHKNELPSELRYIQYEHALEKQYLPSIRALISKDLSEPYSIYVYRYFLYQWGELCFMVLAIPFVTFPKPPAARAPC